MQQLQLYQLKENNIIQFLNQPLPFLDTTKNKLQLIGFTAIYTIIFLYVFVPFNLDDWGDNTLGYIAIGIAVIVCSQFLLRPLVGFGKLRAYSLFLMFLLELFAISYIIYLIYGPIFPDFTAKFNEFLSTLRMVALTFSIPYFLFVGYLNLRHKMSFYKDAENNRIHTGTSESNQLLTITGENDKVLIAINYHQLLMVKSAGNYLELYYLKGENLARELVRASLKDFETLIDCSTVIRVHRSYMLNTEHITSYKKTRKGYAVIISKVPDIVVPVSSGFKSIFEETTSKIVSH